MKRKPQRGKERQKDQDCTDWQQQSQSIHLENIFFEREDPEVPGTMIEGGINYSTLAELNLSQKQYRHRRFSFPSAVFDSMLGVNLGSLKHRRTVCHLLCTQTSGWW